MGNMRRCRCTGFAGWLLAAAVLLAACLPPARASGRTALGAGSYEIGSSSLSLYVNAMGGIQFANGIYRGASVTVDGAGNAQLTLRFGAGQVTIYSITVDTFIHATPTVDGTQYTVPPGYYDPQGVVQTASYTLSGNTALDNNGESVRYVDSMTFPVSVGTGTATYHLWLYVNSNVMGCQFGSGSGSAGSNSPGQLTSYAATLSIDWDSVQGGSVATSSPSEPGTQQTPDAQSSGSPIQEPSPAPGDGGEDGPIGGSGLVEIPAVVRLASTVETASYTVSARDLDLPPGAHVAVSASPEGTLQNGGDEIAFANTLAGEVLQASGDTLTGVIQLGGSPSNVGSYTGTAWFTIRVVREDG